MTPYSVARFVKWHLKRSYVCRASKRPNYMTPFTPSGWIKLKMKYSLILVGLVVYLSVPALIPAGIECQQIIEEKDDDGQSRQSNKLLSLFDWNSYMVSSRLLISTDILFALR